MSSLLWLLIYLVPLLSLTAALFAWFGWHWRRTDLLQHIQNLQTQLDNATAQNGPYADKLQSLQAELEAARADAHRHQDETAKAQEAARALETETAALLRDLDQLRAAHAETQAELASLRDTATAASATVETTKPKRKRSTPSKSKTPPAPAAVSLREIITALETRLSAFQAGIATLTQERDDWQRRIDTLESASPANPADLDPARHSLAESETHLSTTTAEIERLQDQIQALLHVEAEAAALADVPDDDLTQIKGIKKIISEQLRAHGIRTWRQIALWNDRELRAFSELLSLKNRATREQWQEQARALHAAAHGTLL